MTKAPPAPWQEIGWNSLKCMLPATWYPTVIYPAYLFFEHDGRPVFEIKWQKINGQFSQLKTLAKLKKSLPEGSHLVSWELPEAIRQSLHGYTVSGFQLEDTKGCINGLIIYCPECQRATLVQWYTDSVKDAEILATIFRSYNDHEKNTETVWSMYDIQVKLPREAMLISHEFLPGRYTLHFDYSGTILTLYRYKPAAEILKHKGIGAFGQKIFHLAPLEEGNGWAAWNYSAQGLDLLLAKIRRKPAWKWMRLWDDPDQNVILGVKAEGRTLTDTSWLKKICENFTSREVL